MILMAAGIAVAKARVIFGGMPWLKDPVVLPEPVVPDGWKFFTADEVSAVEAIADRLIPSDELSIGGKEAGCALFIDRQLSGDYGRAATQYRLGTFKPGTPSQGPQFEDTPAERYRAGLKSLDDHCKQRFGGKAFSALAPRAAGQPAQTTRIRRTRTRHCRVESVLQSRSAERVRRLLRRSDLWRQQGHGRLEDARLPRSLQPRRVGFPG